MKKIISRHLICALNCALALLVFAGNSQAQTTTFTYQGNLIIGGSLAGGSYDLEFKLYDQLTGGTLQGSPNTVTVSGVTVTSGVFSVELDFGAGGFPGAARYLEIGVRPAGSGSFTTLSPRQQLTSTPYAIRSLNATNAETALNYSGSGASLTGLSASNISSGTLDDARLSSNVATLDGDQTFTGGKIFSSVNGLLATGTFGIGSIPSTGAGTRMMWYPRKAAFRAGRASGSEWDDANVGLYSVAMGQNAIASDYSSVALGKGLTASGFNSVALGADSTASGSGSIALGSNVTASGNYSFAEGIGSTASGNSAIALGDNATASALKSIALGYQTNASGNSSTAMGSYASTGGQAGAFVYGDNSTTSTVSATASNQFNVRAAGGLRFFASSDTSDITKPGLFISSTTGNTQINGDLTVSGTISGGSFSNVARLNAANIFTANQTVNGNLTVSGLISGTFSGSGSSLTNLNASNISSGTLNDAQLSSNVALLNAANTFTANQTVNGNLTQSGSLVQFTPTDGFVAKGFFSTGSIPATGAGTRMMWYPGKQAFRAGFVGSTQWDDANIGPASVAIGQNTTASGFNSVALGGSTTASGGASVALGSDTTASGNYSTALGHNASTNSKPGSFVYGDDSTTSIISASANNQFNVRASGGLRFFASSDTSDETKPGLFVSGTTGNTQINGNLTVSGSISGTVNGASLINLNATNISTGTLDDARLSSNVALKNTANTFTANQTVNANLIQSGTLVQFTPTDGFVTGGTHGSGSIPATGGGVRMMWYPKKAAFRAGRAYGTHWDDTNIGEASVAFGYITRAIGDYSVAMGIDTTASGNQSVALGNSTTASGDYSTALGNHASTNGKQGSFAYGDVSTNSTISPIVDNQFVVRAQRMWFGTNSSVTATSGRFLETSTGAYLTTGGTWTNSSSRSLKTNFATVNPRDVLNKVLQLPIQTWNYKAEDAKVRHIGAISQDFHRLFGFGDSAETISTVDADGVALAAIQGLHEELKDRDARIERLEQQAKQQQAVIDGLRKLLCAQQPQAEFCRNQ